MRGLIRKNQTGMALSVVIGIMAVVAILATGMFVFSYNSLNYSTMDVDHTKAEYLARSGIEIASKAFPKVSGKFDVDGLDDKPVTATLYLHEDADGNASINSTEAGNCGETTVTVRQEKRKVVTSVAPEGDETEVWAYQAKAVVGKSSASAKGFALPSAYANTKPAESADGAHYLGWINADGKIINNTSVYPNSGSFETGGLLSKLLGSSTVSIRGASYNGVVTVQGSDISKVTVSPEGKMVFAWAAPAVVFEAPLDLRNSNTVTGLAVAGGTAIFEKEIHLYANQTESRVGDLILQPTGTMQVYFNDNVYLHIGSSRYLLIQGGTVWSCDKEVDLFAWAVNTGKVNTGLSGWLREIFSGEVKTGELKKVENPPLTQPTANSLTKIVWE